jgi:hypothetical protein
VEQTSVREVFCWNLDRAAANVIATSVIHQPQQSTLVSFKIGYSHPLPTLYLLISQLVPVQLEIIYLLSHIK